MERRNEIADDVKRRQNPDNTNKGKDYTDEKINIDKERQKRNEKETDYDNEDIEKEPA